jgi:hypothetical protein
MRLSHPKLDTTSLTFVQQRTKNKQARKSWTLRIPIAQCGPARVVRGCMVKLQKSPERLHPDSVLLSHWPKKDPSQRVGAALARVRNILNLPETQGLQLHTLRRRAAIATLAVGVSGIFACCHGADGMKPTAHNHIHSVGNGQKRPNQAKSVLDGCLPPRGLTHHNEWVMGGRKSFSSGIMLAFRLWLRT